MLQQSYFDFFSELAQNNDRDWFLANKPRYESIAKEPFLALVDKIVVALADSEPDLSLIPAKQMLFRINRDARFSKDKRPYKEHLSASIGRFGTKDKLYPGHYLQLSSGESMIAGGAYFFEADAAQFKVPAGYEVTEPSMAPRGLKIIKQTKPAPAPAPAPTGKG